MKGIEPLVFFSAPFYDLGKLKLNTFFELNPWLKPRQTKGQHTLNAHGQLKLTTYLFLSQNRNCLCIWSSFLQHRCWIVQSWHLCCLLPFKFIMGPTSTKHTIPSPLLAAIFSLQITLVSWFLCLSIFSLRLCSQSDESISEFNQQL